MAVAALSTAGFSQYISASSDVSASQQAFQSLQQNLDAGNLTAAQSAFSAYNQLNQIPATSSSSGASGSSQFSKDLAALGSAIGAGNLTAAQSAFATVQSDLKATPSQAVTNAETAVAQTVQWVDDLLNLSSASAEPTTPVDPTTAILDSAYGQNTATTSTDPTTSILDSAYGDESSQSAAAASGANTASNAAASSGNTRSSASVNAYA